ncbi:MAG: hypothetical protein AAB874_07345 [Patescibacteria group bacterium]
MNRIVVGIVALLVIIGGVVYASRSFINSNLRKLPTSINVRPRTSGTVLPSPASGASFLPQAVPTTIPLPLGITSSPRPAAQIPVSTPSSGILPATGL